MDVQETTMDQGQQAIRRTAELQRSFAQATLRGIESQQAVQRQAFEFTKAAIGSYVDAMLPAPEDARQQFDREAASAGAQMTGQFQEASRREIPISSSPERTHSPSQRPSTEYSGGSDAGGESRYNSEGPTE